MGACLSYFKKPKNEPPPPPLFQKDSTMLTEEVIPLINKKGTRYKDIHVQHPYFYIRETSRDYM